MSAQDVNAIVRCVSCHVDYSTTLRAFNARGCKCPQCGGSKAQLRSPISDSTPSPDGDGE
jgi:Zn finger protein HypA/HybF involved in hydrogenase expression